MSFEACKRGHLHPTILSNLCHQLRVVESRLCIHMLRQRLTLNFSFDDEAMGAHMSDVNLLSIGFGLVFVYLSFSIGKYSCIEQKVFQTLAIKNRAKYLHKSPLQIFFLLCFPFSVSGMCMYF